MSERKRLSTILEEAGRITEADIENALEYQRVHGGFFGEALVALGIVSRAEVDWALASQFDLPYIFPDPETVDMDAALLVSPDWALAHLAVPIMRAGDAITVVVADPLQQAVIDELQEATGCKVDLALAAPSRIRALIRSLYDCTDADPTRTPRPHALSEFVAYALDCRAERFGVSVRGSEAWGWYLTAAVGTADRAAAVRRVPLDADWGAEFDAMMHPPRMERNGTSGLGRRGWETVLRVGEARIPARIEALIGTGGVEYLVRPDLTAHPETTVRQHRVMLPAALVTELRLLSRSGAARIAVTGEPTLVRAVLGSLPHLVAEEPIRAVHLTDRAGGAEAGVYTLTPGPDDELLDAIEAFAFDAITLDLPIRDYPVRRLIGAVPLAFAYLRETGGGAYLTELGFGWVLELSHNDHGGLEGWDILPVRH